MNAWEVLLLLAITMPVWGWIPLLALLIIFDGIDNAIQAWRCNNKQ